VNPGVDLDGARRVADAVLYEGYILYPYRASSQKNRSRWQFGVLMPPAYAAADPSETATAQSECVFEHSGAPEVEVHVRFLQVQRRTGPGPGPETWDEAVEQEIVASAAGDDLFGAGVDTPFAVASGTDREVTAAGEAVVRERLPLAGTVSVRATPLPGPWQAARLTVVVTNQTESVPASNRDAALPGALVAAHAITTVSGGAFLSMTDPPEWAGAAIAACANTGWWPVLAAPDGARDVMLASPIILPDHPEIAAESPGELYDGTEIDEILTLRTLALTDDEKDAARATDPRAAALLDRVESLALDGSAMGQLHGTIRRTDTGSPPTYIGPGQDLGHEPGQESPPPWWDPEADASVSPSTDAVLVGGQSIARGSRVTLRPGARRADAQDMFLAGRAAMVEAVLFDIEDKPYLAVSLADGPAAELAADIGSAHGRFLYFTPDEVEPL
jgi:hypothetical protein